MLTQKMIDVITSSDDPAALAQLATAGPSPAEDRVLSIYRDLLIRLATAAWNRPRPRASVASEGAQAADRQTRPPAGPGVVVQARLVLGWLLYGVLKLVRLVWPIKVVMLRTERIGHQAYNTYAFLHMHALSDDRDARLIAVCRPPANQALLDIHSRQVRVIPGTLPRRLVGSVLATGRRDVCEDATWYSEMHYPPFRLPEGQYLQLTAADEQRGRALRQSMGIPDEAWVVCVHSRDSAYLAERLPGRDWSHHDFRDCSIQNYIPAAKYLTGCGGYAVRMGQTVAEALPEGLPPQIIDYSRNFRSDFGDVYLAATARFFLGNTAGLFLIATAAGKPVALANFIPFEFLGPFREGDLFLPKLLWSREEKRFLTFREILDRGIGGWLDGREYVRAGLEPVENSAEEIGELAQEMHQRLDGTFVDTEENQALQRSFQGLFRPGHICHGTPVRVGAAFVRRHQELFR